MEALTGLLWEPSTLPDHRGGSGSSFHSRQAAQAGRSGLQGEAGTQGAALCAPSCRPRATCALCC